MARLNENENENESSGDSREGLFAGSRYNTYKILKQAFAADDNGRIAQTTKISRYDEMGGWDAENKAWVYIVDFTTFKPSWFSDLHTVANNTWKAWNAAAPEKDRANLNSALLDIIDSAGEREDRFAEILHQRDAEGCIAYWTSMLGIDPLRHPNTYQLIRLGRKLGEMVVMCLKAEFNAARPSQISPAIVPMFDPPRTACYPAGHALQSYLISYLLLRAMPGLKAQSPEPNALEWRSTQEAHLHKGLFALARRVSDNRVIAGVHFDVDSEAGFLVARQINEWVGQWEDATAGKAQGISELLRLARLEFPQYN